MSLNEYDKLFIVGSQYFIDKQLSTLDRDDVEEHVYYADEFSADEFISTAFTASLFSERKLLILHRVGALKKADTFLQELKRPTSSMIVFTAVHADSKKSPAIQKALQEIGFKVVEGYASSTAKDVSEAFASRGLSITPACASQVGVALNWDMAAIEREAEKLSLYYMGKESVTPQEILNRIDGEPHEKIFNFLDAFVDRQPDKCIKIFTQLPEPEASAAQIFYMLTTYIMALYFKIKVPPLYSAKNPIFNGKTYFMRTVDSSYRNWRAEDIYKITDRMTALDLDIKTGRIEAENALFCLIGALK
ncbi:MAG: hypothetical protein LBV09_07770 [Deferribacteraceae bacterium]|jgi:DNA polymerase III delta subunit|nr:hypothetical protein [Deferribacteraceae bacterium]